ncbi:DUF2799 domain-containing protein [Massilia sp. W12]|uniref:DUF2799 domain-containing protein n=1 Tax=Massilia sp. W12 TaxID=3126507 RepID=UPI0030CCA9D7
MKTSARLLALLSLSMLCSCASLSRDECLRGDWWQIGMADGSRGAGMQQLAQHQKACAEHGVIPNAQTWLAGRKQGLLSYCQAENAFQLGRKNSSHIAGDCEEFQKPQFLAEYARGQEIWRLEHEEDEKKSDLDKHKKRLGKIDERITFLQKEAERKDINQDARKRIDDEWRQLHAERKDNLHRQNRLQTELEHLQRQIRHRLREFGRY